MIRAFIAVSLASVVIEEIAKVQRALQSAKGDIRWTRAEGWHLTLKFLGDISPAHVTPIVEALGRALATEPPLHVVAQGLGAFPHLKHPRVVWAGVHGEGLAALSEKIETALRALDFPPEERALTPHLTLGRVRSLRGWEQVLSVVQAHEQARFGESEITEVTLYQSDLQPTGAVYRALGAIALTPQHTA
ncbi:MAG: RNA 2',3'-cyclic phosphodiesterase [Deltaproteobacteria bacterium]|nr:RNA 2',3'-cyclic phosphodiesterase [Deltaproteobacteria bacterium]